MKNNLLLKVFIIVLIVLVSFWLVNSNQNDKTPKVSQKKSIDLSGKRVVFLSVNTDVPAAKLLAKWFNEETGAVVQVKESSYDKMVGDFLNDYNSKTPLVDVVEVWQPTIAKLVEQKSVYDITELIEKNKDIIDVDDFFPKVYQAYSFYDNRQWALPYDVDTHFLFYRISLFKKYGLNPPKTWNDVLKAAQVITKNEQKNGIYGYAMMGLPVPIILVSSYVNRLSAYGGEFIDKNSLPKLNTPQAIDALQAMVDIYPHSLPSPSQTDYEISRDAFLTGRVAMVDQWTNIGVFADNTEFSSIKGDWSMVTMPSSVATKQSVANLNAGFSIAISSKAPNLEVAKAFLVFAARPDIQKRLALSNTGIDTGRKSVVRSKEFKEMSPLIAQVTEESFSQDVFGWPVHPQMLEMMEILSKEITKALEGQKTAKSAIEDTHNQWKVLLK